MIIEVAFSAIFGEIVTSGFSWGKEKIKERKILSNLNLTIENFNEEFNGTELDTLTFANFLNSNLKLFEYYKDYFLYADNLNDENKLLDEIVDLAIEEINKKRLAQGILIFDNRNLILEYFESLKLHLRKQRLENLGIEPLNVIAIIREYINKDMDEKFTSLFDELVEIMNSSNNQINSVKNLTKIGVRTYLPGTEENFNTSQEYLDLAGFFPENITYSDDDLFWNKEINSKIKEFANKIKPEKEYSLSLDVNQSVAFTLGYYAHAKSNKILYPVQTGTPWIYSENDRVGKYELVYDLKESEGDELLILIDLMNIGLKSSVKDQYDTENMDILTIEPMVPDRKYVLNGDHCMKLVNEIDKHLQSLPVRLKRKTWKFAFLTPNSFIFLLGRQASQYGKIQLLHYIKNDFKYIDSISLG